jgi:hypothetical protein
MLPIYLACCYLTPALRIQDPVLFWTPGSGIRDGKKIRILYRLIWTKHLKSYCQELSDIFWIKNTEILCCGSGILCLLNPGSRIRDGKIWIQDKQRGSATLPYPLYFNLESYVKCKNADCLRYRPIA